MIFQIWNESAFEAERYFCIIKSLDNKRIVTNSLGYSSDLGDDAHNALMDCLTPHTARAESNQFWVEAPKQVELLINKFQKPVIDDEPARCGTAEFGFGGLPQGSETWQHKEQITAIRKLGAYFIYHHDMCKMDTESRRRQKMEFRIRHIVLFIEKYLSIYEKATLM